VRMCASADALQCWWLKCPWEDENGPVYEVSFLNDMKPLRTNVSVGDFIHHGKDPTRRANLPQQVSIITNRVVVAERPLQYWKYEYQHDIGGHYPWVSHYQAADLRDKDGEVPLDYFVWLPRLDQIAKYDCLGPTLREGPHWCLSEFLRFLKFIKQVMWVDTANGEKEIVARSMEQAALMTHMWRAWDKVWIEEKGEWMLESEVAKL